jgi:hypothetical protein
MYAGLWSGRDGANVGGLNQATFVCVQVVLQPDSMVERLLGWLSGDSEQMPTDSGVFPKDVRVEACVLLGHLRTAESADTIHDALLDTMRHCTVRLVVAVPCIVKWL